MKNLGKASPRVPRLSSESHWLKVATVAVARRLPGTGIPKGSKPMLVVTWKPDAKHDPRDASSNLRHFGVFAIEIRPVRDSKRLKLSLRVNTCSPLARRLRGILCRGHRSKEVVASLRNANKLCSLHLRTSAYVHACVYMCVCARARARARVCVCVQRIRYIMFLLSLAMRLAYGDYAFHIALTPPCVLCCVQQAFANSFIARRASHCANAADQRWSMK